MRELEDRRSNRNPALKSLVDLVIAAFDGDPHQSLSANLRRLKEDDWTAIPNGGQRTISDILEHVGWAKWMYEDYAFGSATLRGDLPPVAAPEGGRSREELLAWVRAGHERWLASLRNLPDDAALLEQRLTNWGQRLPTRTIIQIMIGHDFYHAGEINHLRSLLDGDDRWAYVREIEEQTAST